MPGPSTPAQNTGRRIAEVFRTMVSDIANEMDAARHKFAVDMEIEFKSVTLDQKGMPLFSKSTTQSQLQIKIATRITPPEKQYEGPYFRKGA